MKQYRNIHLKSDLVDSLDPPEPTLEEEEEDLPVPDVEANEELDESLVFSEDIEDVEDEDMETLVFEEDEFVAQEEE